MSAEDRKKTYKFTFHKPVIMEADSEQGRGEPVVPGHDKYHVESKHTADKSADDHAVGDHITVRGKRTGIRAGTLFGG